MVFFTGLESSKSTTGTSSDELLINCCCCCVIGINDGLPVLVTLVSNDDSIVDVGVSVVGFWCCDDDCWVTDDWDEVGWDESSIFH